MLRIIYQEQQGSLINTHQITKGLGLVAHEVDWNELPKEGEVGNIVRQALSMYSDILENSNPTAKFMQAMSLFEFLVSPGEYSKSEYLRKIIIMGKASVVK